jgi:septal ring factor EnvC (AmiA/AmiB activator)
MQKGQPRHDKVMRALALVEMALTHGRPTKRQRRLARLSAEKTARDQQIEVLQKRLEHASRSAEAVRKSDAQIVAQEEIATLKAENAALRAEVTTADQIRAELKADLRSARAEIVALKEERARGAQPSAVGHVYTVHRLNPPALCFVFGSLQRALDHFGPEARMMEVHEGNTLVYSNFQTYSIVRTELS